MHPRAAFVLGVIPLVLVVGRCGRERSADEPKPQLTSEQAIARAEHFIRLNGYTAHWVPPWRTLQPEAVEFLAPHQWREFRHNTLESRANGWLRGRKRGEAGWTVVFRYARSELRESPVGRAVTMNLDGSDIRIEHVDIYLRAVEHERRRH